MSTVQASAQPGNTSSPVNKHNSLLFFLLFFFYDCIHVCTNHKTFEPSFIKNDTRNNQFQFRFFFCCRYDQGTGLNWLESVELGGSYDHSKFEKSRLSYNQFICIRERPNCFCWVFFFSLENHVNYLFKIRTKCTKSVLCMILMFVKTI